MHARRSVLRAALPLAALLAGACTDPVAPADGAVATLPGLTRLAPSTQVVSNVFGAEFVESFDLYHPAGTPAGNAWQAAPVLWHPTSAAGATTAGAPLIDASFVSPSYDRTLLGNWSVVKHSRDQAFWRAIEGPFDAWHHPTTCDAPPLSHPVTSYDESVFLCRNHMMTAVNASGYGVTYLTPDRMVDIAQGPATVRFDVATLRNTKNDWIDLWITPYGDNLVAPLDESLRDVDLQGQPRFAIHVRMTADERGVSAFEGYMIVSHIAIPLPRLTTAGYESVLRGTLSSNPALAHLEQSATVRERFVLELSRTRLKFGMAPRSDANGTHAGLTWIDTPIPDLVLLGFTRGVIQIGHHSMNPAGDGGTPTTWHWDNVAISRAIPFTIVNATTRYADAASPNVQLQRPAPSGGYLRFAGHGTKLEVSFDGGRRWTSARQQRQARALSDRFNSYWMPIPAGATTMRFRGKAAKRFSGWFVRDVAVWAGGGTSTSSDDDDDDDDDDDAPGRRGPPAWVTRP